MPWWKEPTKDQWMAYLAAWLGWTLDAFDFTIFLLIMVPIVNEFHVPLADRVGRKTPLMISILWCSICNFVAGFSPSFWFLLLFRAPLGIGMGAACRPAEPCSAIPHRCRG
jgi:SHS family lactate transporter-like MFS transporter